MKDASNISTKLIAAFIISVQFIAQSCNSTAVSLEAPMNHVHIVVYDAGETLGLLPIVPILRRRGIRVIWAPLTPWSKKILEREKQFFIEPPNNLSEMSHLENRANDGEINYWIEKIAASSTRLVVIGLVSRIQEQMAIRLKDLRIPTKGFYDSFDPTRADSIVCKAANAVDEVWAPTETIKSNLISLGIKSVTVVGQPSLENWVRVFAGTDRSKIIKKLGVSRSQKIILFAGQYGDGYEEILKSFAHQINKETINNRNLTAIFSPHPKTEGDLERKIVGQYQNDKLIITDKDITTAELAAASSAVVVWRSTVGIQAAFTGMPVIYYHLDSENYSNKLIEAGTAKTATQESFSAILNESLTQKVDMAKTRRELIMSGYIVNSDEKIADRIAAHIRGKN